MRPTSYDYGDRRLHRLRRHHRRRTRVALIEIARRCAQDNDGVAVGSRLPAPLLLVVVPPFILLKTILLVPPLAMEAEGTPESIVLFDCCVFVGIVIV